MEDESRENERSSAVPAFVVSMIGFALLFFLDSFPYVGFGCGIAGLVLSVKARKKEKDSISTVAYVLSVVCVVTGAVFCIGQIPCTGFFADLLEPVGCRSLQMVF